MLTSDPVKPILVNNVNEVKSRLNSLKVSTNHLSLDTVWSMSDFELKNPIGYGSSATVYSAIYKPHDKKVAIKVINLDKFERNQIDELRRETTLMALSKHPNVLQVFGSFVHGPKLYIVTPYMSPEGLDEITIATILKQVLEGLAYLHKNGHIHRDVKAGNILMDQNGTVLLADFGVASSLMETGVRKTFVGTPCWMAPEVMEQAAYDYKADIWSFGITAIELATGRAPFAKLPPLKVLMLTLSSDPPTLCRETSANKYSKVFKDMVDLCMNKDPYKRPMAEKLLQHPFFKQAKKPDWLVKNLIKDIPSIDQRPIKSVEPKIEANSKAADEWDFSDINNNRPKRHISFGHAVVKSRGHALAKRALSDDFRKPRLGKHQHQASAPSMFPIFQDEQQQMTRNCSVHDKSSLVTFSEEQAITRKTLYRTQSQEGFKKKGDSIVEPKFVEAKKVGRFELRQSIPVHHQLNELLKQNDAQKQLLNELYTHVMNKEQQQQQPSNHELSSIIESLEQRVQFYQRENLLLQRENEIMRKQLNQLLKN
ncbi:Putative STE/STE20/FRAY protein kinase [Rhizopus microsporus]|nr:Putative STE/STE20/FRAY protein kinase [Rhizopus microsporus]